MNVQVVYNGTDITSKVVSYDWEKALCTGIGQLRLETTREFDVTLYKSVVVYEDGVKKGTFFVHTISEDYPRNSRVLSCQDASIKLQTYFIAETYTIDYPSTSDYWISKFLTDATVTYQYDGVSTGSLLSNNTTLGKTTAMDAIVPLLQQNGWYLYFDADNVCHIGTIAISPENPEATLTGSTITDIQATRHDKMFRNRILVWGGSGTDGQWVFSDLNKAGSYANEYGPGDVRTTVISNSSIDSTYSASIIAARALKEFEQTNNEISITVAGSLDVHLGDYIAIRTNKYNGDGMITTFGSTLSENGLYTQIVVGQRCPRLFAFYSYGDDSYVYVGTNGQGIWRKPINDDHTWEDFSTGIPVGERSITDLAIKNNRFACVTSDGNLYLSYGGAWSKFNPGDLEGVTQSGVAVTFPSASGVCVGCAIDKSTGNFIGAYTLSGASTGGEESLSWIYSITNASNYESLQLKDENDNTNFTIVGIDNNGASNIISVVTSGIAQDYLWNNTLEYNSNNNAEVNTTAFVDNGYYANNGDNVTQTEGVRPLTYSICGDGKYLYYSESHFLGVTRYMSVQRIDTTNPENPFGNTVFVDDVGFTEAEFVKAIGNDSIAFISFLNSSHTMVVFDYVNETVDTFEIGLSDNLDILGANLAVVDGESRYYFAAYDSVNNPTFIRLYFYDFTEHQLRYVSGTSVPSSYEGGTFFYVQGIRLVISDKNIYLYCEVGYEAVNPDTDYEHDSEVIIVFHCRMAGYGHTGFTRSISLASYVFNLGYGGYAATSSSTFLRDVAAKDGDLYLSLYSQWYTNPELSESDYKYYVFKYANGISQGNVYTTGHNSIDALASNKTNAYAVVEFDFIVDVDSHASTPIPSVGGLVSAVADDEFPGLLFYSSTTGNVTKILLSGEVSSVTYDLGLTPDEADDYAYSPISSFITLVFDSIYVSSQSIKFIDTRYNRRRKYGIIIPSGVLSGIALSGIYGSGILTTLSGERLIPVDYSVILDDDEFLMKGYKGAYSMVLDTATAHQVEISQPSVVSTWGGTAYSGIVISGVQTGYSYGEIFISPNGDTGTFTRILLNSIEGGVTDLRTFKALVPAGESVLLNTYCIYPQMNQLVLTDISNVTTTPGVIISSGELNSTSYVMAEFEDSIGHIETTNTQDVPYIFVSVSGAFWQRDARTVTEAITEFVDRTNNLAVGEITVIRADDLI